MNLEEFKKSLEEPPKMTEDEQMLVIQAIVAHNGIEKQHVIVMEELAELAQQVSKKLRGKENAVELLEEMADVSICLEMLRYMNDIPKYQLENAINVKLKRGMESCFSQLIQNNRKIGTKESIIELRNEFLKHGSLYDGFSASIASALKEHWCCGIPFEPEEEVAKKILDYVIGDER